MVDFLHTFIDYDIITIGGDRMDFNIDGLFSNVGVNSTRQINAYQYSIYYSRNNMMSNNNLSSVYYAGSAIGILDAYNYVQTTIEERDIANDYFNVKHIKITICKIKKRIKNK